MLIIFTAAATDESGNTTSSLSSLSSLRRYHNLCCPCTLVYYIPITATAAAVFIGLFLALLFHNLQFLSNKVFLNILPSCHWRHCFFVLFCLHPYYCYNLVITINIVLADDDDDANEYDFALTPAASVFVAFRNQFLSYPLVPYMYLVFLSRPPLKILVLKLFMVFFLSIF